MLRNSLLIMVLAVVLNSVSLAKEAQGTAAYPVIAIYTDEWLPYINPPEQPLSDDAVLVNLIALEAGYQLDWKYFPYQASYDLVKNKRALLSYPYFKTEARSREVLFSDPVFKVTSQIYFNRQYQNADQFKKDLTGYRIGKVAGYSYGEQLDKLLNNAVAFPSERSAIAGLLNHQIDLLPITEEVADATLERYFPNRRQLLQPLPQDKQYKPEPLYLIAQDSPEGKQLIGRFNQAIASLAERGVISVTTRELKRYKKPDFAQLMTAEGYPVILGQTEREQDDSRFYTLPNGTQVLVLEWSERILQSSHTDRLYMNMVDLSRVLVLNGPHVGKELFVKNMHIHLL